MKQKTETSVGVAVGVILVFAVFYVYLLMQFSRVFLYYDDYGYLSLSYGYQAEGVAGSDYGLWQAIEYMGHHYTHANGRLLYLFLYLFLYMAGGLRLLQVFMATSVFGAMVLSYKLSMRYLKCRSDCFFKSTPVLAAMFQCLLYGFIEVYIHRHGAYWFAAAFLYVVPAIPFLGFAWIYGNTLGREKGKGLWMLSLFLAYLAGFSQEQWMTATAAFILAVWGYRYYQAKKAGEPQAGFLPGFKDAAVLGAVLIGAMPILTSPAVKARMERDTSFAARSFLGKIFYNIRNIIQLFFAPGPGNQRFMFLLLVMVMLMSAVLIREKKGKRICHVLFLMASALVGIYLFLRVYVWYHGQAEAYSAVTAGLLFGYILWMSAQILFYLFSGGNDFQALIYIAAFCSMACLVLVPELPERVMMPYILLSFPLMGTIFFDLFCRRGKRRSLAAGMVFLGCTAVIGISNMRNIYRGYDANWKVHQYNDRILKERAEQIRQGERTDEIRLYRLLDDLCACDMVYNPEFAFMRYWMNQYYDLPDQVELVYDVVSDMEDLTLDGEKK